MLSISRAITELPTLRRYRLVIVDESHNLRNRESKRFRAIRDYIRDNDSKCILLSATPYNKTYLDLSSQLRLFLDDEQELGIRPDRYIAAIGEAEFARKHQAAPGTLAAFDHSEEPDDWRNLMRLYLVRRTRSFIQRHYAETEPDTGRKFLTLDSGERSYFPERTPRRVPFQADPNDPDDAYARMFAKPVEEVIANLHLPRYGLGLDEYRAGDPDPQPSAEEQRQIDDLSRAGKRLMGFCKTNIFKRLESSGEAFLLTLERHALRNHIFLHALREGLPLPIGRRTPLCSTRGSRTPTSPPPTRTATRPTTTARNPPPGVSATRPRCARPPTTPTAPTRTAIARASTGCRPASSPTSWPKISRPTPTPSSRCCSITGRGRQSATPSSARSAIWLHTTTPTARSSSSRSSPIPSATWSANCPGSAAAASRWPP